jgi:hypothetical protein
VWAVGQKAESRKYDGACLGLSRSTVAPTISDLGEPTRWCRLGVLRPCKTALGYPRIWRPKHHGLQFFLLFPFLFNLSFATT